MSNCNTKNKNRWCNADGSEKIPLTNINVFFGNLNSPNNFGQIDYICSPLQIVVRCSHRSHLHPIINIIIIIFGTFTASSAFVEITIITFGIRPICQYNLIYQRDHRKEENCCPRRRRTERIQYFTHLDSISLPMFQPYSPVPTVIVSVLTSRPQLLFLFLLLSHRRLTLCRICYGI